MKRRTCTRCKIEMMTNAEEEPYFCIECKEEIEQCKHDEELIHIGKASRQAEIIVMINERIVYLENIFDDWSECGWIRERLSELRYLKQQILEEKK